VAQLATASSVSASMLSAVERGQGADRARLGEIADGLGLTLRGCWRTSSPIGAVLRGQADHDTVDEPGGWQRTVISLAVPDGRIAHRR
jgi:transcriptional regulator with XRE-family HTH domain